MTEEEVEAYRRRREITVDGRDVPKPVLEFRDVGFPGNDFETAVAVGNYTRKKLWIRR